MPQNELIEHKSAHALPDIITVETVTALAAEFSEIALPAQETFVLDAVRTETITTPGIQLIISLARACEQMGSNLRIINLKPAFAQALHTLGLGTTSQFNEWEATQWLKKS